MPTAASKTTATVVWREAPSSGHTGYRAIIDSRGEVRGWVGGGCTKGILLKEASAAMQESKSRLVKVKPFTSAAVDATSTSMLNRRST